MFNSVDVIWVLVATALVFFMQAGFALVESGLTRAKNAGNIIMKNLMDYSVGSIMYWIVGFGIMFGGVGAFCGFDLFIQGNYDSTIPTYAFVMFQTVFCATAATIVSGAMAERTKFSSYLVYSIVLSAFIYPVSGHWIWGGGWLAELGFHDFAGSTAVHMVGGLAALIGAKILGPRIGKYSKDGKAHAIPGHNITMAALGVFILWFCWFGFNGGSTVSMTGDDNMATAAIIFMTTSISASAGAVGVMLLTWFKYGKPDVSMTLNGVLAGLVGITAGCDLVSVGGALAIGLICGIAVVFGIEFIDQKLKIDDPVGAVGVHGICGSLGTILVGLFATTDGLLYGGGFKLLGIQTLGVVSVMAWVGITMTIVFTVVKKTLGLRVSAEDEIRGLDIMEHGLDNSYADFMPAKDIIKTVSEPKTAPSVVKVTKKATQDGVVMTKVVVVTKESRFPALKAEMDKLGVTGMTVINVMGRGMQTSSKEIYRGLAIEKKLLKRIQIDIVVCKIPVEVLVDAIKRALHTGAPGDGKIFVYDVENVIKISTNEEGYAALQDDPEIVPSE